MRTIKKVSIVLTIIFVILLCTVFSACNLKKVWVGTWDFHRVYSGTDFGIGVPFHYEFDKSTIEVGNYSENGIIVFNQFDDVIEADRFSDYDPYYKHKQVTHADGSFEFKGDSVFYWVTVNGKWNWENRGETKIDDYIRFIARTDNKIVGFAVIYVWTDGEKGGGKVLTDKRFSKNSKKATEEYVSSKINKVIEKHKK